MVVINQMSYGRSLAPTSDYTTGVLGKGDVRLPKSTIKTKAHSVYHYLRRQIVKKNLLQPLHEVQEEVAYQLPRIKEATPSRTFVSGPTKEAHEKMIELNNRWDKLVDEAANDEQHINKADLTDKQERFLNELPIGDRDGFLKKARKAKPDTVAVLDPLLMLDVGTDPMPSAVEIQCNIGKPNDAAPEVANDIHELHKRSMFRKTRDVKFLKFYSKLTYYLRCKYFMKTRDRALINMMANDARIWMLKERFTCETEDDFLLMTQSVCAAYVVNNQELHFRQILKNKTTYDNMKHLNDTLAGNLGKAGPRVEVGDIKSACSSLFCKELHMPVSSINA